MNRIPSLFISLMLVSSLRLSAAVVPDPGLAPGSVTGMVIDSASGLAVEYANIVVFSLPDSAMITGGITNAEGKFILSGLKTGTYYARIQFVGYEPLLIDKIEISNTQKAVDLGKIVISPSRFQLMGAEVVAERSAVEYRIDKQVINASQIQNAANGNVIDLLRNSPSITVDNDDNVLLRGSQNYILLVDGKPTLLEKRDAMRQIPSSTVENIEIITNPSAKYDAEGTAGIINIITKKIKGQGFSALINARIGTFDNYGGDASLAYSAGKWGVTASASWGKNTGRPTSKNTIINYFPDSIVSKYSDVERLQENTSINAKAGIDFNPNAHNSFSLSAEIGNQQYVMGIDSKNTTLFSTENSILYGLSNFSMRVDGNYEVANFNYVHTFDTTAQTLTISAYVMSWGGTTRNHNDLFNSDINWSQLEQGNSNHYDESNAQTENLFNLDYVDVSKKGIKIETGYQYSFKPFNGNFNASKYDVSNGLWVNDSLFTTGEIFNQSKHAGYLTLSGPVFKSLEFQAGIRSEYYDRIFELSSLDTAFTFNHLYWFPSFYLSKKMKSMSQLQLSYSRRVSYPDDWSLSPVPFYNDGNVFQTGNANLKPEFIDSYELNFIKPVAKGMISLSAFYRQTNDAITRLITTNDQGVLILSTDNIETVGSLGAEAGSNFQLTERLSSNISLSIFNQYTKGRFGSDDLNYSDLNINGTLMLNYKLGNNTRISVNGFYNGPAREAQGMRKAMGLVGLSVRQDFMKKRLSATLNFQDVFNSFSWNYSIEDESFCNTMVFKGSYPRLTFGISYRINNYRPKDTPNSSFNLNVGTP